MTDFIRLALATAVVLTPGVLVARTLGQRTASAAFAWGMACIFAAWAVVFAVHGTITLALVILGGIGVCAFVTLAGRRFGLKRVPKTSAPRLAAGTAAAVGVVVGAALWRVAGIVGGDGLFHLARVRKLVDLGDLHLRTVDEFKDGGLHPGYAFPLWHGFLALVTKVSGLDPTVVMRHEASILAILACLLAWELGYVVFGSALAGFSVLVAQLAIFCLAAGDGGAYASLALPATAARQLLVPAATVLFFTSELRPRKASLASVAVAFGALTLVHPTYALFLLVPLAGYSLVRIRQWRSSLLSLAAAVIPTLGALLWLKPIVDETISHNPGRPEQERALRHYSHDLHIWSLHHFRLEPAIFGRSGSVAVAALLLIPLAGFSVRRRWGAYVLGGGLSVLLVMLVPTLFEHFSDAVSLSQSRRAAGFVPFSIAFAGGLAILFRSSLLLPLALVGGIFVQHRWPGDFGYGLTHGGPAFATWWALIAGGAALVLGLLPWAPRLRPHHGLGAAAAVLFVLPVLYHDRDNWSARLTTDPFALSPQLVRQLQHVPPRSVIIADPEMSYRILAYAPVYVVSAPVAHVANTTSNKPKKRYDAVKEWQKTHNPAIPKRYGATWEVVNGRLQPIR